VLVPHREYTLRGEKVPDWRFEETFAFFSVENIQLLDRLLVLLVEGKVFF
jgi:hypothetical protein